MKIKSIELTEGPCAGQVLSVGDTVCIRLSMPRVSRIDIDEDFVRINGINWFETSITKIIPATPQWPDDAPDEAEFLTQDKDGMWCYHRDEPKEGLSGWVVESNSWPCYSMTPNWRNSKISKPKPAPEPLNLFAEGRHRRGYEEEDR